MIRASPAVDPSQNLPASTSTIQLVILVTALCLCIFLAALDVTIITTALPTISQHFGSVAGYTWVGAAYTLAEAASTTNWGKMSDIWGRKPILQVAIVVFFLGSVLSATSVTLPMLIVGRSFQGPGGGGLLTLVSIIIGDLFSMRYVSWAFHSRWSHLVLLRRNAEIMKGSVASIIAL